MAGELGLAASAVPLLAFVVVAAGAGIASRSTPTCVPGKKDAWKAQHFTLSIVEHKILLECIPGVKRVHTHHAGKTQSAY